MTTIRRSTAAAAAGNPLVRAAELLNAYVQRRPDATNPDARVSFGTSGHRGSSLAGTFNEAHVLAITQAICEYRISAGSNRKPARSSRPHWQE
jgi:phosphoglucomutase